MIFSKVEGHEFRLLAVGSPTIACGVTTDDDFYVMRTSTTGIKWHKIKVPEAPVQIDCAADGTYAMMAEGGTIYLYRGGKWGRITHNAESSGTPWFMNMGAVDNVTFINEDNSVWRYYGYFSAQPVFETSYLKPGIVANMVGTGADGSIFYQRYEPSWGRYFMYQSWLNTKADDAPMVSSETTLPAIDMTVVDTSTMFYIGKNNSLIKYCGNAVLKQVKLEQLIYNPVKGKHVYEPIPGDLFKVNAGTDNQVAMITKEGDKYVAYMSVPKSTLFSTGSNEGEESELIASDPLPEGMGKNETTEAAE